MPRSYIISLLAGLVFAIHALFYNAHSWPLVWPLAGGILAVTMGRRHATYRYKSIVQGGITGGIVVWVACLLAGWFISEEAITHYYQELNDPFKKHPSLLFSAVAVACTFIVAWLFSSGVTTMVTKRKAV